MDKEKENEMKPWTLETFPKDKPIYLRRKSQIGAGCLAVSICITGVMIITYIESDKHHLARCQWVTWAELLATCCMLDGSPCGVK